MQELKSWQLKLNYTTQYMFQVMGYQAFVVQNPYITNEYESFQWGQFNSAEWHSREDSFHPKRSGLLWSGFRRAKQMSLYDREIHLI